MPLQGSTKRRRGRATGAAAAEADALISLPPEVLDDILNRVGILDAVRTSVLSRVWRCQWEELSSLDLSFPRHEDGLRVVDGVFLRCPGRVQRFCAHLDNTYAGRIHDWLRVLSRRGVEILDLSCGDGFPAFPSSVFSCGRLTSLSLCGCSIPLLPPGFMAFPELRSLALENVRLQDCGEYQLEEIIDTSPLLEDLVLQHVFISGAYVREWAIRAPNLSHLSIYSKNNQGWILKELTSLSSAVISLWEFIVHRNFTKFLSGLIQVRELLVIMSAAPVKLQAIRSETGFGKMCGLWSEFSFTGRFYLLMQYFGLEMQYTENGFSRNCLLRLKGSC
ncbi:hypothetical protein ACQ4PT_064319 [Festuca glaucescens]